MSKRNVVMRNWELYFYGGKYNLSGFADEHYRLGKRVHITYTTSVVDYKLEDNVLIYETENTIYRCPLKYMTNYPYGNVVTEYKKQLVKRINEKSNILDRIIAVAALIALKNDEKDLESEKRTIKADCTVNQLFEHITTLQVDGFREMVDMENQFHEHLITMAKKYEDCVYMELSNINRGDKLAYNIGGCTGIIKPLVHVGMFQDSVLYMQYHQDEKTPGLDFRYFPKGLFLDTVETYSWSDNILNVVIKNDTTHIIYFNGEMIERDEIRKFTQEKHNQGLISPDCYNGKSMFFSGVEEE